jgi:hypothetical protein
MARYIKCQYCESKELWQDRDKMIIEQKISESGKTKNLYYHKECYPKELKKREMIAKELKEKDELDRVVKEIYNCKYSLPPRFWELINDLRNGTIRYVKGSKVIKKYKKGVPYPVIKEAYLMSKQDIEWARLNKNFKTLDQELHYGLKIIQSKLNDAYKKLKRNEQIQEMNKKNEEKQIEEIFENNKEVKFVKKKSEIDISHILGDD